MFDLPGDVCRRPRRCAAVSLRAAFHWRAMCDQPRACRKVRIGWLIAPVKSACNGGRPRKK
jgi:hypothetical protein